MTIAPERESPSLKESSESDWDFSVLKDAAPSEGIPEESQDQTAESKTCPTCQGAITRAPGQKGRLPKYHPECKPSASRRLLGVETPRSRAGDAKKIREADEVIAMIKPQLFKAALMLAAVDRFDAFVVMNNIQPLCSSVHGVLVRYDNLRKDALNLKSGGSIFGLFVTALTTALPILAHHGLIPGQKLQEMLIQFPVMMFKLMQRMQEGEAAMQDMMNRVSEEMLRPKRAANATANGGQSGDDSTP